MTPSLSIIIVHYKVEKEILACLKSIASSKAKNSFEIIIVDNDTDTLKTALKKQYPSVKYIKSHANVGYSSGNNAGARVAKGEFLFFLNPDTKVFPGTIDTLFNLLKCKKEIGIVAPLLLGSDGKPYQQGAEELTPVRAVFALSFLHRLFPRNPIAQRYYITDWNYKNDREVDVVPGTAFMIPKKLFETVGRFDEHFFLYFEEFDLCKRIKQLGYKSIITPSAKVMHEWGVSTKQRKDISQIFNRSRFYYLKKHFGLFQALCTEMILRFNKYIAICLISLLGGGALAIYKIADLMPFIGDYGWFYISARDMLLTGNIPLVGIASSHPWLHQGAFWTYLLAGALHLFSNNPISGAYVSIGFYAATIICLYIIVAKIFSKRVGAIASLLYATSPSVILNAREPYHTSPIPFFTVLFFFAMYQWLQGKKYYFPIIILLLGILYNFEIATFLLTITFLLILSWGLLKRTDWFRAILTPQILIYSIIAFIIPMLPMLVYDVSHGYPQTLKFIAWGGYKVLTVFGYPPLTHDGASTSIFSVLSFLAASYQKLIYAPSSLVSLIIGIFSFGFMFVSCFRQVRTKHWNIGFLLLSLIIVISIVGIIAVKTTSDAYLPLLFPMIIILTALFFDILFQSRTTSKKFISVGIFLIAASNSYFIINQNYFVTKGYTFTDHEVAAKTIVSEAKGRGYNLVGKGNGSQFASFTMNYEYLTWLYCNPPAKEKQNTQFSITETKKGIVVRREK